MPGKATSSRPEGLPGTGVEPGAPEPGVFPEPWQAAAFAIAVALNESGLFSWTEWAAALAREVGREDAAADGSDYWHHWLRALETLLAGKGVAEKGRIDALEAAWQRAARSTPHGKPILLGNDPLREARNPELPPD
jgi:nitrile hydratase accessory protein